MVFKRGWEWLVNVVIRRWREIIISVISGGRRGILLSFVGY